MIPFLSRPRAGNADQYAHFRGLHSRIMSGPFMPQDRLQRPKDRHQERAHEGIV
jgi:hypothetical protein